MKSSFLRHSINAFYIKILAAFIGFSSQLVFANILGAIEYGKYIYMLTWVLVISIFSQLGFRTTLVRFIAKYNEHNQQNKITALIFFSFLIVLLLSNIISITGFILNYFHIIEITTTEISLFHFALILLPIYTINIVGQGALQGSGKPILSLLPWPVISQILAVSICYGIYYYYGYANSETLMFSIVSGSFIAFGFILYHLKNTLHNFTTLRKIDITANEWFLVSLPLMLSAGMQILLRQIDILMIGSIVDTKSAGIYSAASRISDVVTLGLTAVNTITAPLVSKHFSNLDKVALKRLANKAAKYSFFVTTLTAIMIAIFSRWLLNLFGSDFTAANDALLIMLIGQVVNSVTGPVGVFLSMTGHQNAILAIISTTTLLNFVMNYVLISLLGIKGAAIATTISMITWNALMFIYTIKILGINTSIFTFGKTLGDLK